MQRDPNLVRLSLDHQAGWVLAKRARELATAPDADHRAAWTEIQTRFADELEPHFQLEERGLLPALRLAGQVALVEQILNEHAELRALIGSEAAEAPVRFGDALYAHIRFEERTLFETAQQILESTVLAELGLLLHEAAAHPACSTTARKGGAPGMPR
ncbi:MAG: hemerythrin domain-containing protein [Chromatiaceae bacterium]|nr:hemerythrin domain-containing protein [Chromatiaceae bacterium]